MSITPRDRGHSLDDSAWEAVKVKVVELKKSTKECGDNEITSIDKRINEINTQIEQIRKLDKEQISGKFHYLKKKWIEITTKDSGQVLELKRMLKVLNKNRKEIDSLNETLSKMKASKSNMDKIAELSNKITFAAFKNEITLTCSEPCSINEGLENIKDNGEQEFINAFPHEDQINVPQHIADVIKVKEEIQTLLKPPEKRFEIDDLYKKYHVPVTTNEELGGEGWTKDEIQSIFAPPMNEINGYNSELEHFSENIEYIKTHQLVSEGIVKELEAQYHNKQIILHTLERDSFAIAFEDLKRLNERLKDLITIPLDVSFSSTLLETIMSNIDEINKSDSYEKDPAYFNSYSFDSAIQTYKDLHKKLADKKEKFEKSCIEARTDKELNEAYKLLNEFITERIFLNEMGILLDQKVIEAKYKTYEMNNSRELELAKAAEEDLNRYIEILNEIQGRT